MYVRTHVHVRTLPDVRKHSAASPLTSHVTKRGHVVVVLSYHKVEAEHKATIARTAGSRRAWLGRGDSG